MNSSITLSAKVEGLAELNRTLRGFGFELATRAVNGAVAAGGRVIRDAAKEKAPIRTGTLRRAFYVKRVPELSSAWLRTYIVGVRRGKKFQKRNLDAFYFPWVEFGSKHNPKREEMLTRAFAEGKNDAVDAIKSFLQRAIIRYEKQRGSK